MPRISELEHGQQFDGFFLLRECEEKMTRQGKVYLDMVLEDRTGNLPGKVWEVPHQVQGVIEGGDFVKVRALAENYRGTMQLKIEKIRRTTDSDGEEGFREEDCIARTSFDTEKMWKEIFQIAQSCHPLVAELLVSILEEYADQFQTWPAAQRIHHPYLGGLLEHTLSVTKTCLYLVEKYDVSRDLLVAGALLHDIGKLHELSGVGGTRYTSAGRLVGHIVLGRDILRNHAQRVENLPEEFVLHLEHLILSHQGQPDWGTVKVPMTPEAVLLHYADDMDAKFNIATRAIEQDRGDGEFTSRIAIVDRAFFKLRPLLPPPSTKGETPEGQEAKNPDHDPMD